MLERYEGKLSRTVLRRGEASNRLFLVGTNGADKIASTDKRFDEISKVTGSVRTSVTYFLKTLYPVQRKAALL